MNSKTVTPNRKTSSKSVSNQINTRMVMVEFYGDSGSPMQAYWHKAAGALYFVMLGHVE